MKEKWKEIWEASPRSATLAKIDDEFPMKRFHSLTDDLTREQTSMLIKIRTGHIPLNDYLHKRKRWATDKCAQCTTGRRETWSHFLHECQAYRSERRALQRALGYDSDDAKKIFSKKANVMAILEFVRKTGRLRHTRQSDRIDSSTDTRETQGPAQTTPGAPEGDSSQSRDTDAA